MEKRQKPVTFCTVCGKVGYNIGLANENCIGMYGRKRCHGVNSSALNENDWAECPSCKCEGWKDGKTCERCDGAGWLLIRDRPWVLGN